MASPIYYLPGHGGRIGTGLGEELLNRGFDVSGRETVGDFKELSFSDQVNAVAADLSSLYWHKDAHVIANSFGAYLFLHAQSLMTPYIGKVLLLSPIVGNFSYEGKTLSFIPPRAGKLQQLAETSAYPTPINCEIHVGEEDWQSIPGDVTAFAAHLGIGVTVVPGAGHMLGKEYVGAVLDRWLPQ
jgi:hypothetical protein